MTAEATPLDRTVLVTGGSGFVGSWCAIYLLRQGYRVRATIRDLAGEGAARAAIAKAVDPHDRLSFHAANLMSDDGWDQAAETCTYVLHVASPMSLADITGKEAIDTAREGTLRVLRASVKAGVNRVVMTSSTAAARPSSDEVTMTESSWTAVEPNPQGPFELYGQSKTVAERAAWDFAAAQGGALELSTILPVMIQGPVLGPDYAGSVDLIAQILRGAMPDFMGDGMQMVDVRDLADLHVKAMTSPNADGERFIAAREFLFFSEVASILRAHLGERAPGIPVRDFAPADARSTATNSSKAQEMLAWRPRPMATSLIDTAESLLGVGGVQLTALDQ
jgi:dihydroflavonol-4-reductase